MKKLFSAIFCCLILCVAEAGIPVKGQQLIVKLHNQVRRAVEPPAANMRELKWDETLAKVAQEFASQCLSGNNDLVYEKYAEVVNRSIHDVMESGVEIGEIAQVIYGSKQSIREILDGWFRSRRWWNYYESTCMGSGHCDNYLKTISADTDKIGCASKLCKQVFAISGNFECENEGGCVVVVCNYFPGTQALKPGVRSRFGDEVVLSDLVYIQGTPCSKCPQDLPYCNQGLCTADLPAETDEEPRIENSQQTTESESAR